jgi:hypothetical protein
MRHIILSIRLMHGFVAYNAGAETQGGDPGAVAPGKEKKKIIQANIYEK